MAPKEDTSRTAGYYAHLELLVEDPLEGLVHFTIPVAGVALNLVGCTLPSTLAVSGADKHVRLWDTNTVGGSDIGSVQHVLSSVVVVCQVPLEMF